MVDRERKTKQQKKKVKQEDDNNNLKKAKALREEEEEEEEEKRKDTFEDDDEDDAGDQHGIDGLDDDDNDDNDDDGYDKERLKKEARRYRDEIERRGVVYLSSLPPFMKPAKVKHLLEKYGPITRIYLVEEDATTRKRRIKSGGNRKKKYTEGWIEYADKNLAKQVAKHVNGTQVGGKKRNFYHDDMWNIKYLKGFKWRHLTEKLAYERRVREQKLRVEMMQAKKENALFTQLVEQKKQIQGMESRKRKKREEEGGGEGGGGSIAEDQRVVRRFRQVTAMDEEGSGRKGVKDKSLLKNVFKAKSSSSSKGS